MNPFRTGKLAAQMAAWATPHVQEWLKDSRQTPDEGERQLLAGNYEEAEKLLTSAAAEAEQRRVPGKRKSRILVHLTTALSKQGKFTEAWATLGRAAEALDAATVQPCAERVLLLSVRGQLSLETGDTPAALVLLREALEMEERLDPPTPARIAERCHQLGEAYRRQVQYPSARSLFERALEIVEKIHGPVDDTVGRQLSDLGRFLHEMGEHEVAIKRFDRALEIHQKTRGTDSNEVAEDYEGLAIAWRSAGDLEKSVSYYQKALYLRERQLGGSSAELAALMVNLAEIYKDWGRYAPAVELLQQAISKFELKPDTRLAQTLENLGGIYDRSGRYAEAATCLTRARGVWQQTPGDHSAEIQANLVRISSAMDNLRPEERDALCDKVNASHGRMAGLPSQSEAESSVFVERTSAGPHEGSERALPFGMDASKLPHIVRTPQQYEAPPMPACPPVQIEPVQMNMVTPVGRPIANPPQMFGAGLPNYGPIQLTFIAPENPPMAYAAEPEDDELTVAAKLPVPPPSGLKSLPVAAISMPVLRVAAPPEPFRRRGVRLRRRPRTLSAELRLVGTGLQPTKILPPLAPGDEQPRHTCAPCAPVVTAPAIPLRSRSLMAVNLSSAPELEMQVAPETPVDTPFPTRHGFPTEASFAPGALAAPISRLSLMALNLPSALELAMQVAPETLVDTPFPTRHGFPTEASFAPGALAAPISKLSLMALNLPSAPELEIQVAPETPVDAPFPTRHGFPTEASFAPGALAAPISRLSLMALNLPSALELAIQVALETPVDAPYPWRYGCPTEATFASGALTAPISGLSVIAVDPPSALELAMQLPPEPPVDAPCPTRYGFPTGAPFAPGALAIPISRLSLMAVNAPSALKLAMQLGTERAADTPFQEWSGFPPLAAFASGTPSAPVSGLRLIAPEAPAESGLTDLGDLSFDFLAFGN